MEDKLRRLQLTQLEILEYVDAFCRKNDIKYSLYAGTMIGAVRHKGFIPWDDDLDIFMPRDEYNRFIELWNKEVHEKYLLQNKDNTPSFTQSFTKIRKKNTNFLQEDDLGKDYHTGIFIDIFPVDRITNNSIGKKLFQLRVMVYQLMMREFVPKDTNSVIKLGCNVILKLTNSNGRLKLRNYLLKRITKFNNNTSLNMVTTEVLYCTRLEYPSNLFDELVELEFENRKFSCVSQWDISLRLLYGNYIQFPPVEERMWRHKPVVIDFEKGPEGDLYA